MRHFPVIRLPDIAFGAEAWALVELEIPAGSPSRAPGNCCRRPSPPRRRKASRWPLPMRR
jgi:hypothetical protein